jgi:hypothetical protein
MKKNDEDQKRLKLDVETVRRLQSDELDNVVGAVGEAAAIGVTISLSWRDCKCVCN